MRVASKVECYAARLKDMDEVAKSRSGGVFISLCNYVISHKGVVYGCSGMDPHVIMHKRADDIDGCKEFRKSKYIQSELNNTFRQCMHDLNAGRMVLFSGTGCEIQGLLCFLRTSQVDLSQLITVDLICYGVPSPGIFGSYINLVEEKAKRRIIEFDFRIKQPFGWRASKEKIVFDDGSSYLGDEWITLFYSNLILRPACYECPFASVEREADFTIGDYWGIENNAKEFDDDKGVNIVIIHTEKGKEIFLQLNDIVYKKTDLNNSLQPNLICPSNVNKGKRHSVMRDLLRKDNKGFQRKYLNKYSVFYLKEKIRNRVFSHRE